MDLYIGQNIEVEYRGNWFPATVRDIRGGLVDIDWEDGTFATGLLRTEVRPIQCRGVSPDPPLNMRDAFGEKKVSPTRPRDDIAVIPSLDNSMYIPAPVVDIYSIGINRAESPLRTYDIPTVGIPTAVTMSPAPLAVLTSGRVAPMTSPPPPVQCIAAMPPSSIDPGMFGLFLQYAPHHLVTHESIIDALFIERARVETLLRTHPLPEIVTPLSFNTWLKHTEPGTTNWLKDTLVRGVEQRRIDVEARVNMTGSPHRTRQEAAAAAVASRSPTPVRKSRSPSVDHRQTQPCTPDCAHRPSASPHRRMSRMSSAGSLGRRSSSLGKRSSSLGRRSVSSSHSSLPQVVVVSGVKHTFRNNLNGRYSRALKRKGDSVAGIVTRYQRILGNAVLYRTNDGRWRLNDSHSPVGWVYSNGYLVGKWIEDAASGDYTGAAGTAYPIVKSETDRKGTRASSPGRGHMSSGTPRMSQKYRASTDALYNTRQPIKGRAGSFGNAKRFTGPGRV